MVVLLLGVGIENSQQLEVALVATFWGSVKIASAVQKEALGL